MTTIKARVLFTEDCNRRCKGCCNKNWTGIPPREVYIDELDKYDEINVTGGEPMLYVEKLKELINTLKSKNKKVYLYTALPTPVEEFLNIIQLCDGISLTLHTLEDYNIFRKLELDKIEIKNKELRLNVFPKVGIKSEIWDVRYKTWIKDCPLPEQEELLKLIY